MTANQRKQSKSSFAKEQSQTNKRLLKNSGAIKTLSVAKNSSRKSTFGNANRDLVMMLMKCASDIINGGVRLSPSHLRQLQPYEQLLKRFITSNTSLKVRRLVLQQGFVGVLIKPILSILPSLLGG